MKASLIFAPARRRLLLLGAALCAGLTSCPRPPPPTQPVSCPLNAQEWAAIEAPDHSAARVWNELALNSIRNVLPQPTVHARTLFHLSAAMYDTWATFDPVARGVFVNEQRSGTPAQVEEAVNRAAHRVLSARFTATVPALGACFDDRLRHLGLNPDDTGTQGDSASATGNRTGQAILDLNRDDGSNERGGYADTSGYRFSNEPLRPEQPGVTLNDPDRWQRLLLAQPFTQNGIPQSGPQPYMGAHWGAVKPFAMTRQGRYYHDPGPAPSLNDPQMRARWIPDLLRRQSRLDDRLNTTTDISPAALGNNTPGRNDGAGHALNPTTGLPYPPNVVRLADYGRVIAEYWADGPRAETPPGHWNVLANAAADAPTFQRRLGGRGPELGRLEWDLKMYLALNGALHDAAIAAWDVKRQTDTARPISLVRFVATQGMRGLQDEVDVLEERGGKAMVRGWSAAAGVQWIDPLRWVPYQAASFVSPAFPGFVSGHSTFSRAAAEVLTDLTGSAFFPGGLHEITVRPGALLIDRNSNAAPVRLQWATYADAADQAGQSRIWGGIHIEPDDLAGRRIGHEVGLDAVALARRYFTGQGP